jgi:hypothetical protein
MAAGAVGFLAIFLIIACDSDHNWDGSIRGDPMGAVPISPTTRIALVFLFPAIPAFLMLLLGWVVAGFRRQG